MSEEVAAPSDSATVTAPASAVAAVRRFTSAAGGAHAVIQPVGATGVRITLVGEAEGLLGDVVVADVATAEAVVAEVDGVELAAEWDRALISATTVRPSHYQKMAGWVARQRRFPKPRNRAVLARRY